MFSARPGTTSEPSAKSKQAAYYRKVAIWLGGLGTVAFAGCLFFYWKTLREYRISENSGDWGTFGDFIGGIAGTVVSLLALIALAYNLYLQASELEETRGELRKQAEAMRQQTTEATFFRLLANRQETLARFRFGDSTGRAALLAQAMDIAQQWKQAHTKNIAGVETFGVLTMAFERVRAEVDPLVGSTMQLLRFVQSIKPTEGSIDYRGIALADLSFPDQVLLFFVGLSGLGKQYDVVNVVRDLNIIRLNSVSLSVLYPKAPVVLSDELLNRYKPKEPEPPKEPAAK